jgi:hypothetical protein
MWCVSYPANVHAIFEFFPRYAATATFTLKFDLGGTVVKK